MKAYPPELRRKVFDAYRQWEGSLEEIASRFGVSVSFVRDLARLQRETGSLAPRPHRGGRQRRIDADGEAILLELVLQKPDSSLAELCARYEFETGTRVSRSVMGASLRRMGVAQRERKRKR